MAMQLVETISHLLFPRGQEATEKRDEILEASRPGTADPIRFLVLERQPLDIGYERKERVRVRTLSTEDGIQQELDMISKQVDIGELMADIGTVTPAEWYYKNWSYLSQVGLPTIPELFILSDDTVLMTDLTISGSKIYGRHSILRRGNRSLTQTDRILQTLTMKQIEREAIPLIEHATSNGVWLPYNDPLEIIIHEDGTWGLLILDLTVMTYNPTPRWPNHYDYHNKMCLLCFLQHIRLVREELERLERRRFWF